MGNFTRINDNIFRLTVPFCEIYTTVYLIKTDDGFLLFDTATYDSDVTGYIIPFLNEIGVDENTLKYVFISHSHGDHAGGLRELMKHYPKAVVLTRSPELAKDFEDYRTIIPHDNESVLNVLSVIAIPGHSLDSAGFFDTRTKTLICGDSLQLYGIYGSGGWGTNIPFPKEHLEAIEKLRKMDIECIYTAHDYHPCGFCYKGKEEITRALDFCTAPLFEIMDMIKSNPDMTDEEIAALYNKSQLPVIGAHIPKALRKLI